MKKSIEIKKVDKSIEILMNSDCISTFEMGKNKINGQVLYEKLDINIDDIFTVSDSNIIKKSNVVDDIVIYNTYEFVKKLTDQINKTLNTLNNR
ncbi:MAG: hypothetical protein PHP65_00455 [Bacilli bacterium]|nr:hypothetical protein [Bacilli bacterium]